MSNLIYGYIDCGSFVETGLTEIGAKIVATKRECVEVGYRSPINNMYINTSMKICGYWSESGYMWDNDND